MLEDKILKKVIRQLLLNDKVSKETILNIVFNTVDRLLIGYDRESSDFYEAMIEEIITTTQMNQFNIPLENKLQEYRRTNEHN